VQKSENFGDKKSVRKTALFKLEIERLI